MIASATSAHSNHRESPSWDCTSIGDVIQRLEFVLQHTGGAIEEEDEPGLPMATRQVEKALRESIRFLQTLTGFIMCHAAIGAVTTCSFWLGPVASSL